MSSISTNTDLVDIQKSVSAMEKIETGLAQLRDRFVGRVYDVSSAPGMTIAKADRAEVRELRFEVERRRKEGKAPLLALGKWADQTAARITAEILKIEAPIDTVVKAEEDRIAAEKQEKINAELARVSNIQGRIAEMREAPTLVAASDSAIVLEQIAQIDRLIIDSSFAEFEQEAVRAKYQTVAALRGLHAAAVAREVEADRIAAERIELDKLRAAQAQRDREDKIKRDAEERTATDARNAEQVRIAGEQRAQREAFEKEQRETRERQAAEDRRIAEDRAKLEREQAALRKPPARKRVNNPGSEAIVEVVANFYSVDKSMAAGWLKEIDWETSPA